MTGTPAVSKLACFSERSTADCRRGMTVELSVTSQADTRGDGLSRRSRFCHVNRTPSDPNRSKCGRDPRITASPRWLFEPLTWVRSATPHQPFGCRARAVDAIGDRADHRRHFSPAAVSRCATTGRRQGQRNRVASRQRKSPPAATGL
jgi:hypothetical protein